MWGQVVVALGDDDTIRRRRADADERASIFVRNVGGEPPTGGKLEDVPGIHRRSDFDQQALFREILRDRETDRKASLASDW